MNLGILGAGNIGGSLGRLWAAKGHAIMFGVRAPNSPKTQAALSVIGANARVGTIAEAAAWGEVIVLAVPWGAVQETLAQVADWHGKILIDTTNRLAPPSPSDSPSAAEDVAKWAVGAKVCKAFNTLPWETIADSDFHGEQPSIFVCGDDAQAKQVVMQLVTDANLDAVDSGPLANAAHVETLTKIWFQLQRLHGRQSAFKLLRR